MSRKTHDIAVKTGEYQDREGNTKGRWQNVGALMKDDEGRPFIVMERTFNPAGVPNPDGRSTVILSCFEPQQSQSREDDYWSSSAGQKQERQRDLSDLDDEIPF